MHQQVSQRDRPVPAADLEPRQVADQRIVERQDALASSWSAQIAANDFEIEPIWSRWSGRSGVPARSACPTTRKDSAPSAPVTATASPGMLAGGDPCLGMGAEALDGADSQARAARLAV